MYVCLDVIGPVGVRGFKGVYAGCVCVLYVPVLQGGVRSLGLSNETMLMPIRLCGG